MTTEKKERKKPTPRNFDSILKGALELELSEQVKLVVELKRSITEKVEAADKAAAEAKESVKGL